MISADLLSRLQEADSELWKHYQDGMITGAGEPIPFFDESLTEAWLQHCLQDAIRARKWSYRLVWASSVDICKAFICTGQGVHESVNSDTEAEALLIAYLAAIEAMKG